MKNKRFGELISVALGFTLIFVLLLVERIGILYTSASNEDVLLMDDRIVHDKETRKGKECLVIWDDANPASQKAIKIYDQVLTDMRVPHDNVNLVENEEKIQTLLKGYSKVVLAISDLESLDTQIIELADWVGEGGRLLFGLPPYKTTNFNYVSGKIGVISASEEYAKVDDFASKEGYMLGAARTYPIIDGYESALSVVLDSDAKLYASTGDGRVPLVWSREYQKGKFVVCNFGYAEKAYRGIYASAFSLLDDIFIYPVINASTFYIDDFPSPVPAGNGEYVKRDYNMGIADFYSRVWWPDMLNLGRKHDIQYTGLIIETYQDTTEGELKANESTSNYYYYGNMLLNQGGELGYHGYNHQPLCLPNFTYKQELGYKTWADYETMNESIRELIRFSSSIFPNQDMSVYVPPSDVLSDEGRSMLGIDFPQVKCIASIYLEGQDEYVQEFEVSEDGIVETPRIVSGGILDDYMRITAFAELNLHFVSSHFMHPDDLLDEDRGADLGWAVLKENLDDYMGWVDEAAVKIRHVTGSGMAGAVQRYVNLVPDYQVEDKSISLNSEGLIDSAYYLIRANEGQLDEAYGGELYKLNDTLYLLKTQSEKVTIIRSGD
ncbi:DUF2194 domain-containing protein [Butyrivibrio sp. VCB2006]|uniref:DUF2194 domain-containing protein n=1 Tax=Butyrivibrio sp. VCB2006 TaxID=1280679 RepID=UPI0004122B01|nr:DUF2194 domain-containing protein [Butyrivibrio sp. VCB2006]